MDNRSTSSLVGIMAQTSKYDVVRMLGELNVVHSKLEFWVGRFISWLITEDNWKLTEIIIAELSVQSKITLLLSLYRYKYADETRIKRLASLLEQVRKVNKQRNDLIHSTLEIYGGGNVLRQKTTAKFEKGYQFVNELIRPRELQQLIDDTKKHSDNLSRLLIDYREYQEEQKRARRKPST
jgi:hypothetical protein